MTTTAHHPEGAATIAAESVVALCHRVGKHFLPAGLLRQLDRQRSALADQLGLDSDGQGLLRWLHCVLDKFDGRYHHGTYLVLDLLDLPDAAVGSVDPDQAAHGRDVLVCWLLSDVLNFELRLNTSGDDRRLPLLRPDARLRAKRARLALRAAAVPARRGLGLELDPAGDPAEMADALSAAVTSRTGSRQRRWWPMTMMPVYQVHDEWMFIRILQAYEASFAQIALWLAHAVDAIGAQQPDRARTAIGTAAALLTETGPLFSLMATLQRAAFHRFRVYTDGASAIQSANFKLVEVLCGGPPSAERLASIAYDGMPHVRRLAEAQDRTLPDVLATAHIEGLGDQLHRSLAEFCQAVHRWRTTHASLAQRMLGPAAPGTGATEGLAYLAATRHLPALELSESKEAMG
jgi:tryptophan 2,3-dioxygenase